ncbi:MAG TPA: T9SS type A sorting domain-containing protein, partial [Tenuifilaceae bacterium]|nr:T9SS type A sorting domain-containing protein [Tenuifilaceae bacterium]
DLTVNAHGTGVANLQQAGINLYPNPTAQMLTVELGQNKALRLTVTDLTGRVVLTKENPTQTETLDLSPLSNGVYLLVVQTNGKVLSTRVVKK